MMGLLTGYQDDAERLAGKEKALVRGHNHDLRGLKAEAAPHETTVKDYNKQVEGFKDSAIHYKKTNAEGGTDDVLWQVVGYLGSQSAPTVHQPINYPGGWNYQGAPQSSSVVMPTVDGKNAGMYRGSGVNSQGMYGYYAWGNSPDATLRDASGNPVRTWQSSADSVTPIQAYASRNDKPFVAPLTQSQVNAANASDAALKGIGARSEARTAEFAEDRRPIEQRTERIADDIAMSAGRLREEVAPTQQSGSVFDQNMAGIHQSISDWLNA
jgi:hypothetical protein